NFAVDPPPPAKLAYLQQPSAGVAGAPLAPFVVAVEDIAGHTVSTDASTVTLTLSHGTFADGSTSVSAPALNGVAEFDNLVINAAGSYVLRATDTNPNLDPGYAPFTINPVPTSASLSASLPSPVVGQSVTFTATIGGGTPAERTGASVTFQEGSTTLGTGTRDAAGNATFTTAALAVGDHTIVASYAGDAKYGPSSTTLTVTVLPLVTVAPIITAPSGSVSGPVTITWQA